MGTELKPCPFCGGEARSAEGLSRDADCNYFAQTGCRGCGALGPKVQTPVPGGDGPAVNDTPAADAAWNCRK